MKFHLLVAASALVVGLGTSGMAFAGDNHDPHGRGTTSATSAAVALSDQDGAVILNFAKGTDGANAINSVAGTGLVNIQQNNGANSILQDQNTLGAILNCSCTSSSSTNVLDVSLAASAQSALVLGNVSIGAENRTSKGSSAGGGGGFIGDEAAGGFFWHKARWDNTETAVQSSNGLGSFTGTGLYNISQNNGNNSMLQSGNTVAAIVGK